MPMPVSRLNNVNGEIIKWARENAGYSLADVVRACSIKDEDTLQRIEAGDLKPTLLQAESFAKKFNRPLAFFYLKQVPKLPEHKRPDNRSLMLATDFGPATRLAIRRLNLLQDNISEMKVALKIKNPVLPAFTMQETPHALADKLRNYLGIVDMPRLLHRDIALDYIVSKVESKGILVSQQSMPRTELQGASSLDPYPVILINHTDYKSSKIFTLMHELCHLSLRTGGYCLIEPEPSKTVEAFCNDVAGEALVPLSELTTHLGKRNANDDRVITSLADYFSVSREVVLLRLIRNGFVDKDLWDIKESQWRAEYSNALRSKHLRRATTVTRALRENGHQFTHVVMNGFSEGIISSAQASRYLNVRGGVLEDIRRRV